MEKKSILIIDDFEPLLEEVVEFLAFEGFKTYSAKDGAEGIQMAIQHIPNLIICDIEMPKLDGYEVYKALDQIPSTSAIPFIFLTARAQPSDFRAGLSLGVDDYIIKPFELDELVLSITKRLEKHEKLKKYHENKFMALVKNPTVGFYIYQKDQFILANNKFTEITSYQKNDLNKLDLEHVIMGNSKSIKNELCMCAKGVHDSFQMKISIISKDKKALFLEIFGKFILLEGQKTVIGSIIQQINETKDLDKNKYEKEANELDAIINYLLNFSKQDIAEEIVNIRQLIAFEEKALKIKIKEEIKLTKRELEVVKLICKGLTNNEIAEQLFISSRTVDNHRANLLAKTATKNTASLVAFVISKNLIQL